MNRFTFLFLAFFFIQSFLLSGQEGGVTISPSDGNFNRCYPDTVVAIKIKIPENYTAVDSFALQWCSDCAFETIAGSLDPAIQTHKYTLAEFKEKCEYDRNCNFMGICLSITDDSETTQAEYIAVVPRWPNQSSM